MSEGARLSPLVGGVRVLHFSDVHVDAPLSQIPLRDWAGKRLVGGANHILRRRRRFRDARPKLAKLAEFADAHGVELSICTGDYTVLGTDVELAEAADAVEPLTRAPLGFVTVPGNHDLYTGDSLDEARFEKYFGKHLERTDLPELRRDGVWPVVRLVGANLAVVAISSARPNPAPWRSSGHVPEAQLEGLAAALAHPELQDRYVIVMTHYALRLADGRPDSLFHRMDNADQVMHAIAEIPRGCFLHGHVHHLYKLALPGVRPAILGAGSATQDGREGVWMLDISPRRALATPVRLREGHWALELDRTISI